MPYVIDLGLGWLRSRSWGFVRACLAAALCWLPGVLTSHAAQLVQVAWPTANASAPPALAAPAASYLPAFRLAVGVLPESEIISLALSHPAALDITAEQAADLQPLLAKRYELLARSPLYSVAPSALPYCYSEQKPAQGFASVYVPDGASARSPAIVFLHGYGGSFGWCQQYLSEAFPGYIIICPAYGISCASTSAAYVNECLAATARRLGYTIAKPSLIGLSAGGYGACKVFTASPDSFSQLICLAACPPPEVISLFQPDSRARFLAGGAEAFVASGEFKRSTSEVEQACRGAETVTLAGADQFFLLTHREGTLSCLRRWLAQAAR